MSAPESTAVIPPHAPAPAAAPATVEHISALHRHLDEIKSWVGEKFKEVVALVEKAAPVAAAAAAAVAPMLGAAAAPVIAAVEEVAKLAGCCGHAVAAHSPSGCSACKCTFTDAGARSSGAPV